MTSKELAQLLDGRERGNIILTTEKEQIEAKKSGLIIAYGESNDLLEFEGAFFYESYAYEGCTVHIKNGYLVSVEDNCEECPHLQKYLKGATEISAVWHDEGSPCWKIETDIPHETFETYMDGELFCVGIVFAVADTMDKLTKLDRSLWEGCGYCNDTAYEFLYCPMCGKPMTEEAWKQLERRIGGNDGKIDF